MPKCANLHTVRVCCNIFCFPKVLWVNVFDVQLPVVLFSKSVHRLCVFTYPSSSQNKWGLFLHHALHEHATEKFSHALRFVSHSVWTTVGLHGCKCSSFIAVCADAGKTPIYSTHHSNNFIEDVSNLAPFLSGFSSVCMCILHVLFLPKKWTCNWKVFTYWKIVFFYV